MAKKKKLKKNLGKILSAGQSHYSGSKRGSVVRGRLSRNKGAIQQLEKSGRSGSGSKHLIATGEVHAEKFAQHQKNYPRDASKHTLAHKASQSNAAKKAATIRVPLRRRHHVRVDPNDKNSPKVKIVNRHVHGDFQSSAASGKKGLKASHRNDQNDLVHQIRRVIHSHLSPSEKTLGIGHINSRLLKYLGETKEEQAAALTRIANGVISAQNRKGKGGVKHDGVSSLHGQIHRRKDGSHGFSVYHK